MADTTIQKQGEVFISQSEYDALRLAGNLQSNTKYHITKTPKTATEDFVNNGFVAKIGTATQAGTILYGRMFTGNETGFIVESIAHNGNSIVQRKSGGAVEVGTPVGVNDATTKAYVDGLHHYTHHIVISDGTSEIFITLAIKNHPNAVTTLDGVTELVFDLTEGGMQPIMATGVVDGHNVHAVLVQADQKLYANFYDSTKGILTDKVQVLFNDTVTVHDMVV